MKELHLEGIVRLTPSIDGPCAATTRRPSSGPSPTTYRESISPHPNDLAMPCGARSSRVLTYTSALSPAPSCFHRARPELLARFDAGFVLLSRSSLDGDIEGY